MPIYPPKQRFILIMSTLFTILINTFAIKMYTVVLLAGSMFVSPSQGIRMTGSLHFTYGKGNKGSEVAVAQTLYASQLVGAVNHMVCFFPLDIYAEN